MSKVTKTMLKSIVKECLVEILSEGLSSSGKIITSDKKQKIIKKRNLEEQRLKAHRDKFEVSIDNTVSTMTEDPIMQEILQDTARTTLQEQLSNESKNSGPAGPGINLDSIFESPGKNWGKLAFDE